MIPADDGADVLSLSPSFSSYSSRKIAEISARVVSEFRQQHHSDEDHYVWEPGTSVSQFQDQEKFDGEDDEFVFATVCREPCVSVISADEIFYNGQIRPTYPLFGTEFLQKDSNGDDKLTKLRTGKTSRRSSLRMLMSKDREMTSRSSSLTAELVGVSPETYCAWPAKDSESSREKSKSSGSSRRWRFMNFLNRSSSDGKEMIMALKATNKKANKTAEASEKKHGRKVSRVGDNAASGGKLEEKANQTEEQVRNNREIEEMDAKKSNFLHREPRRSTFSKSTSRNPNHSED